MNKRYILSLVAVAVMSFAIAAPAFADDGNNDHQGGPRMGFRGDLKMGPLGRPMMAGMRPDVAGKVQSVSGNTITITNRGPREASTTVTFTIDASNAVVVKGNATSTVGSIAVGDVILVKGTITGTNVVATKIFDGPMMQKIGERMEDRRGNHASSTPPFQGNGQPVVAGTVSAVSGNTITIINSGNASYTVDVSGAKIIVKGNQNASVSNVSIEDHVVVQGAVNGASITATSVLDGTNNSGNGGDNGGEDKGPKGFFGGIGGFFKHLFGF